jgi:formylglycine-generating enzyme required for sulfatase activity
LSGAKDAKDQPFKRNIEIRLQTVMGLAKEGDFVLVAFSGHGTHINGDSYICPADADPDSPKTTMIKVADIYAELNKSKATFKLLVVDACRNIPLAAEKRSLVDEQESLRGIAKTFAAPPSGILVLSSSAKGQYSYEDPKLKLGVFMAFLQYGLTGVADTEQGNRDGQVSLLELYKYTHEGTSLFVSKKYGTLQTPSLHGDIAGDFVLGVPTTVISNTIDMTFNMIPAGTFLMGSPESEEDRGDDEQQHPVTISRAFYMQTTEVTQGQWKAVMGTEPWKGQEHSKYVKEGANYPAVYVSWDDAVAYCKKLSDKEAKTYRLPTEAEWEYACRAGTETRWSFGNDEKELGDYAWYGKNAWDVDEKYAHQVRLKKPNAFGLYDMHGNVIEWCHDYYGEDYYKQSSEKDPTGPTSGSFRVLRGGSWDRYRARNARSAFRFGNDADFRYGYGFGFRLVRELD